MHYRRPVASSLLVLLLVAAVLASGSCGKSSSPTSPTYGAPPPPPPATKELNSGVFGPGQIYQHVFAAAGTYLYHCQIHAPMTGSVTVAAGGDSVANVSITSSMAPFPAATVRPGGKVIWTNNTTASHTVTSD